MRILILHNAVAADAAPDERDVLDQVEAIAASLARLGHEPAALGCDLDLPDLGRRLAGRPPPTSSSTSWRAWAARAA